MKRKTGERILIRAGIVELLKDSFTCLVVTSSNVPCGGQAISCDWDYEETEDEFQLSEEQIAEFDRRLKDYEENPTEGSSCDEVKERILAHLRD